MLKVPKDRYFVVQDDPASFDSRTLHFARRESVLSTRLYKLGGWALIRPVP